MRTRSQRNSQSQGRDVQGPAKFMEVRGGRERGGKEGEWCNLLLSNSIPPVISLPKSLAVNG